jgi:hypothetical protein
MPNCFKLAALSYDNDVGIRNWKEEFLKDFFFHFEIISFFLKNGTYLITGYL